MGAFITEDDLKEFVSDVTPAKLAAMIEDAEADATRVAPCLVTLHETVTDPATLGRIQGQVRSILRQAITRWAESGSGAVSSSMRTAGPITLQETIDTKQSRRGMFWPSEITALQGICKSVSATATSRAFNIDQAGLSPVGNHQPWCSVTWGDWCSCGANLTRGEYPLWEGGELS